MCSPPRSSSSGVFVGGPLGSFTGRLAEVQSNDNASFLPSDAESTRVTEVQEGFQEQTVLPAIIIWESEDGLSAATQQAAVSDLEAIASLHGVVGQVSPPIPSEDGQALQAIVLLDPNLGEGLIDVVEQIRHSSRTRQAPRYTSRDRPASLRTSPMPSLGSTASCSSLPVWWYLSSCSSSIAAPCCLSSCS